MANYSDWAAEKNIPAIKLTERDKRAILIFWTSVAAFLAGLLLVGRYLHLLY